MKTFTIKSIQMKPYPAPYALHDKAKTEFHQKRYIGIIEETESPYTAPVVLIKKSDKTLRFCVDVRELNKVSGFD